MVSVPAGARSGRGASRPKEEPSSSPKGPPVLGGASPLRGAPPVPGRCRRAPRAPLGGRAATEGEPAVRFGKRLWFPGGGWLDCRFAYKLSICWVGENADSREVMGAAVVFKTKKKIANGISFLL